MVRIRGGLEVRRVTGIALRGHRLKLPSRSALMAGIAIHCRMRSSQRKAVVVLLNLLNRYLPSSHGMTLFAVRSELAFVNVGVTVLTALTNIKEDRLDVALRASDGLMHSAKRIFRPVVIEFRNGPDWLPRARCVAILARNVELAVWAVRTSASLRHCARRNSRTNEQRCCQVSYAPQRPHLRSLLSPQQDYENGEGMTDEYAIGCPSIVMR